MSNVSKCFSCAHKKDYDPKFGYYGCNLSGWECKGYSMFEPKAKPRRITNADRIRAMTDEELANLINRIEPKFCHDGWDYMIGCDEDKDCVMCWLDWLKQEVEDG